MRDPWGCNERLFALYYPHLLELAERAGQRETRRQLLSEAAGRTLELGAGSGVNLAHYPAAVSELVISEPSPHMLARLRARLVGDAPPVGEWRLVQTGAESLPFDDASFDTVVATYIMCTVPDPGRALGEIHRVLRPGGRYLFMEHVRADQGTLLGAFQDLVEIPHRYIAAGCHPNRHTAELISDSRLELERLQHGHQPHAPLTVRPRILGSAIRTAD